jgi:hypothetical protein
MCHRPGHNRVKCDIDPVRAGGAPDPAVTVGELRDGSGESGRDGEVAEVVKMVEVVRVADVVRVAG